MNSGRNFFFSCPSRKIYVFENCTAVLGEFASTASQVQRVPEKLRAPADRQPLLHRQHPQRPERLQQPLWVRTLIHCHPWGVVETVVTWRTSALQRITRLLGSVIYENICVLLLPPKVFSFFCSESLAGERFSQHSLWMNVLWNIEILVFKGTWHFFKIGILRCVIWSDGVFWFKERKQSRGPLEPNWKPGKIKLQLHLFSKRPPFVGVCIIIFGH